MRIDKLLLFKILAAYFSLAGIWTLVCILFGVGSEQNANRLAWGFIPVYPIAFIIGLDLWKHKTGYKLLVEFIVTFFFSFLVCALLMNLTNSLLVGGFIASLLAMMILNLILNHFREIQFLGTTIILASLVAMPAFFLVDPRNHLLVDYHISPSIQFFNTWQGLTIIPMALGLSVTTKERVRQRSQLTTFQ